MSELTEGAPHDEEVGSAGPRLRIADAGIGGGRGGITLDPGPSPRVLDRIRGSPDDPTGRTILMLVSLAVVLVGVEFV